MALISTTYPNTFKLIKVIDNPTGKDGDFLFRSGVGTIGMVIEYRHFNYHIAVVFKPLIMCENKGNKGSSLKYIWNEKCNLEIPIKYIREYL